MKRREFIIGSCVAGGLIYGMPSEANDGNMERQLFELRTYQTASKEKRAALIDFLGKAAIPAWNQLGIKPVGVFQYSDGSTLDVIVLLPHHSWGGLQGANEAMMQNKTFVQAGGASLKSPKKDPLYLRYTSSLLLGFEKFPRLGQAAAGSEREFQLRIYESHNLKMARRKIEMFNRGGEIDVFLKTGLRPLFFSEALIGDRLPNLTYMLSFENEQQRKDAWKAFGSHPDWKKLNQDPYYKDTVSHITNLILKPAAGSQL